MSESENKRGRGRPPVYSTEQREIIAALIKLHNAASVQRILHAKNGVVGISKVDRGLAEVRKAAGFASPVKISLPTLNGIAAEYGVQHGRGRPVALTEAA